MLESIVVHHSGTGVRGGDGNVVGISWKALTRSNPSPSLVVTCTHQVVVYKPGESRRTHQWSFKPSAATALSHSAVFLPGGSRYVGVQQGSTLVSWRESELDVKRPLSAQASGTVQAVHACPQLGDYFVAVLSSGGVALYQGGLQLAARCDEATGGAVSASPANSRHKAKKAKASAEILAKAVWSGVLGNKVLVLENIGATDRVTTFHLSAPPGQRKANASAGADGSSSASVTLVSSHVLKKPMSHAGAEPVGAETPGGEEVSATACAAAFLGEEGKGGRNVVSVAWRTLRGPAWTKVVLDAAGAREELARPVSIAAAATAKIADAMVESNGSGVFGGPVVAVSNGHGHIGSPENISVRSKKSAEIGNNDAGGWGSVPAVASADGGRLLVHSGGASPRLTIWDAAYGVLLDDDMAPGAEVGGNAAAKAVGKAVSMVVSGDGAHVGISAAGKVIIGPLPLKEAGTLASLLRRKRPSSYSAMAMAATTVGGGSIRALGSSGLAFPSVDLARNGPASNLLGRSGALEAAEWEAAVVTPFRDSEEKVIQSLRDAARRKDRETFERVLREHGQRRASSAVAAEGRFASDVTEGVDGERGRKKRRRKEGRDGEDYSPRVVAAAVELCLKNPEAELWNSLAVLVRSGGVSARQHRGLVPSIVEHASPEVLEEVMHHVPDLPEADAVRILRHLLAQAASSAEELPTAAAGSLVASDAPPTGSEGDSHRAKRARGIPIVAETGVDVGVDGITVDALSSPTKGSSESVGKMKDISVSTRKKSKKSKKEEKKRASIDSSTGRDAMEEEEEGEAATAAAEGAGRHKHANGAVAPTLSNGNGVHAAATQEDGGTSGDSGGCSEVGALEANTAPGTEDADAAAKKTGKNKKKRARAGSVRPEDTPAARAERGVRVALTFPHNEAFLRSALAGLSHGEVVVVLKVLTRLIAEGRTKECSARTAADRRSVARKTARGLPPARTDLVLGWAAAVLDAHFARLAVGGSADAGLVSVLKALKRATRGEAGCCELLCEVRSLVDELGRQHAAAAAAAAAVAAASKRRPKRDLFTLRVLRF